MAGGDPWALMAFIQRFEPRVYGLALRVVGDPGLAEEIAQDAFVRVWRRAATFDPQRGQVASWLLTITRNIAIDALRLRRDPPIDPLLVATFAGSAPDAGYQIEMRTQLDVLPTDQARVVVLAAYYGYTVREVADIEGIPLGTAKTRLRRGLARLRTVSEFRRPVPAPAPRTSPGR